MMGDLFRIYKSKVFWLIIIAASILGALYSEFIYDDYYDKMERSEQVYICFENTDNGLTINDISDSLMVKAYFDLIFDKTTSVNYRGSGVMSDQKFYLLEVHDSYPLSRIIAYREHSTMGKARFYEGWIWNEYLQKEPCP